MPQQKSWAWFGCFILLILFFPACLAGETVSIRSARERRVEKQREDNKEWKKRAEQRETDLYDKAERYYRDKQYNTAADYYRRVLDVRYRVWRLRSVSGTITPARKTSERKLDTSRTRQARVRLASIGDKVRAEKEKKIKARIKELSERAEVAAMLGDQARAYHLYGELIRATESMKENKVVVSSRLKAIEKRKEILANIIKPLDEIEKLLEAGKTAEAQKLLQKFKREHRAMIKAVRGIRARFLRISKDPEVIMVDQEQEVQQRIIAGDTALLRNDFITAESHYRSAATMYVDVPACKEAAAKLAKMLNDPEITAAKELQLVERECKPLVARARYLIQTDKLDDARKICKQLIAAHPETKWAAEAQEILNSLDQ